MSEDSNSLKRSIEETEVETKTDQTLQDNEADSKKVKNGDTGVDVDVDDKAKAEQARKDAWKPPPIGGICWFEVPCLDLQRASNFYSKTLDWKLSPKDDDSKYLFINRHLSAEGALTGGLKQVDSIHAIQTAGDVPASSVGLLYYWVESIEDRQALIEKEGGKCLLPKTAEGDSASYAIFSDTEGNRFAIYALNGK